MALSTEKYNTDPFEIESFVNDSATVAAPDFMLTEKELAARRADIGWKCRTLDEKRLPKKPRCAGPLKISCIRSLRYALLYEYIQIDLPAHHMAIVIDIDEIKEDERGLLAWYDLELPTYSYAVGHQPNERRDHVHRAHVVLELEKPVAKSSPKQMAYYHAVRDEIIRRLEGGGINVDHKIPQMVKNPESDYWATVTGTKKRYTLTELAKLLGIDHLEKDERPIPLRALTAAKRRRGEETGEGRNCDLFEIVRHIAYAEIGSYRNAGETAWREAILKVALNENNNFPKPLSYAEVRGIAKSIARWVWNRYSGRGGDGKERGVMKMSETELPLHQKQRLAGQYGARQRAKKSLEKIAATAEEMVSEGLEITKKGLARRAGVALNTVKKHWAVLDLCERGQFGVHQAQPPGGAALTVVATDGPAPWAGQEERTYNKNPTVEESEKAVAEGTPMQREARRVRAAVGDDLAGLVAETFKLFPDQVERDDAGKVQKYFEYRIALRLELPIEEELIRQMRVAWRNSRLGDDESVDDGEYWAREKQKTQNRIWNAA